MKAPQWGEVTAIFGGRMDPPHLGHRQAVLGLLKDPGVKNVLVIPSASPPHKPAQAGSTQRLEMSRIAFSESSNHPVPRDVLKAIQIDEVELHRNRAHPGRPSYSFDTIQELRQRNSRLAFALGADQFKDLPSWHRFPEILGLCHWIVILRKPHGEELARSALQQLASSGLVENLQNHLWSVRNTPHFIQLVTTDAIDLSSTQIRQEITKTGSPPDSALLPEVETYLKTQQLYGIKPTHDSKSNH